MIVVLGSFRLPVEAIAQARPMMRAIVEATLGEPGCRAYSYAQDIAEPGLFRVTELWSDRQALAAHLDTAHMRQWREERAALGFSDRAITVHEIGPGEDL